MRKQRIGGLILALVSAGASAGCNVVGPGCTNETGTVANISGDVKAGAVSGYSVTSPKSSNLVIQLKWADLDAMLTMRAVITDCGGHSGCQMTTIVPSFGPGGSSPVPQPWPAGYREMEVDGWKGKTYRVEVMGDGVRDTPFTLNTTFKITCER